MASIGRNLRRGAQVTSIAVRAASTRSPDYVARTTQVDPQWQRVEDGRAARLRPNQTISVARRVGRWRAVDPLHPQPVTGIGAKTMALGIWAGALGAAWWIGSRRRRGPLASVADLDQFGSAVTRALEGFDEA